MPLTAIEAALFSDGGTHAIAAFTLEAATIRLSVAPWTDQTAQARGQYTDQAAQASACFRDVRLLSRELLTDDVPQDREPPVPWAIMGFDSYPLSDDRWRFVLSCAEIEYMWESTWPDREPGTPRASTRRDAGPSPHM